MHKIKSVKNKYDKMYCNINTAGTVRDMATKASLTPEQVQFNKDLNQMIDTQPSEMKSKNLFE